MVLAVDWTEFFSDTARSPGRRSDEGPFSAVSREGEGPANGVPSLPWAARQASRTSRGGFRPATIQRHIPLHHGQCRDTQLGVEVGDGIGGNHHRDMTHVGVEGGVEERTSRFGFPAPGPRPNSAAAKSADLMAPGYTSGLPSERFIIFNAKTIGCQLFTIASKPRGPTNRRPYVTAAGAKLNAAKVSRASRMYK
jgi:hypothetical protein